jgi:hypothetical protein
MEIVMTTVIQQNETAPAAYPDSPAGVPASLTTPQLKSLWQRIEAYTAYRYTSRAVVWVVEGPDEWHAPLSPASISTVEVWSRADVWETATLTASPLGGYRLPCTGPYRFTGTVGGGSPTVPEAVYEAYRRLAVYAASAPGKAGATRERIRAGSIDMWTDRSASWMANALQNSGAADLLRGYRHV